MEIQARRISTLQQFYALMADTRTVRLEAVTRYLQDSSVESRGIESLENAAEALKSIPSTEDGAEVDLDERRKILIDLSYEINELDKDILFLSSGEEAFEKHLRELHPTLDEQVRLGTTLLDGIQLRNFITDRDGTINNYCGRYLSSIQSIYNSVYVSRFAQRCVKNAVILTSAPLENGGLVDITTTPNGIVINAGSKGREYRNLSFKRATFAIDPAQQAKLDELNSKILEILKEPRYEKFGLIGSAFQQKFGQTTIARQDVSGSVGESESLGFLRVLENVVEEVDPGKHFFRIEDTGLDVEIILTVSSDDSADGRTDFSKGNGVDFLNQQLKLDLDLGPNLICGDTGSDVPMLEESLKHSSDTWTIFVTVKKELKNRVFSLSDKSLIVDEPDTLVVILNALAKKAVA